MTPRARRVLEMLLVVGIAGLCAFIGVHGFRILSPPPPMVHGVEYDTPNVSQRSITIPGRPHDIPTFIRDPQSIRRRVTFTYSTNSLGLRGPEPGPKAPGTFRIVCAGECVTFGNGVNDDETWPHRLQEALRRDHPQVEVVNAGVVTHSEGVLKNLMARGMPLRPDLVVFSPGSDSFYLPQHTQDPGYRLELDPSVYAGAMASYRKVLTQALDTTRVGGASLVLVTPPCNSFYLPDGQRWVDEGLRFASERGVPVLDSTRLMREAEERDGLIFVREGSRQRLVQGGQVLLEVEYTGDRYISPQVYQWLDDHPDVAMAYNIDENHPNPDGHRLMAQALMDLLGAQGLLPAGR